MHASPMKKIIRYITREGDALFTSNAFHVRENIAFQNVILFSKIEIDSFRRRVFVHLGSDLHGTHSEQRGQCLAGLHFLYSRINPEQCYNGLNRARLRKPIRKPFSVTLTFSSVIGARAPITNHYRHDERDTHSILAAARVTIRVTPSI